MRTAKPFGEIDAKAAARFWSHVDRRTDDECWLWRLPLTGGYGQFSVRHGQRHPAHRVAYRLTNGECPHELLVCHRCDNGACCNPAHLFLGTYRDNAHDMIAKGRHGKRGPRKLTLDQVLRIKEERRAGGTLRGVAKRYGVTDMVVHKIMSRQIWKEVPDAV